MKRYLMFALLTLFAKDNYSQTTYTFIGKGNWSVSTNWSNNIIPPDTIFNGSIIYISPLPGDTCFLDTFQIMSGASLIISPGAHFVITKEITINNISVTSICNQIWVSKNLNVSTYRNGDSIPQITNRSTWDNLTTVAWCYYNNNPANGEKYGKLYNWYAVNDPRGLAPAGYHIPNYSEWGILSTCLGGDAIAGSSMKEKGTTHWLTPNLGATNSSGFFGLPSGFRYFEGLFDGIGNAGDFWSSTQRGSTTAFYRDLDYNHTWLYNDYANKTNGFSVRCIKD